MFICNRLCMSRNVLKLWYLQYDVNGVVCRVYTITIERIFMDQNNNNNEKNPIKIKKTKLVKFFT